MAKETHYEVRASSLRDIGAIHFENGQACLKNGDPIYEISDNSEFDKDLKELFRCMFDAKIPFDSNFGRMAEFNRKHNIIKKINHGTKQ